MTRWALLFVLASLSTGCGLVEKAGREAARVLAEQRQDLEAIAAATARAAVDELADQAKDLVRAQVNEIGDRMQGVVADQMDRALVSVRGRWDEALASGQRKVDAGREDDLTLLEILTLLASGSALGGTGLIEMLRRRGHRELTAQINGTQEVQPDGHQVQGS